MGVSSISPVGVFGIGGITPITALLPAVVPQALPVFDNSSTIVSLSGLGQLLSAVSFFQTNLAALQPGSSNSGIGKNFGNDFGSLAAEAQNFVDTFNNLQSTFNSVQGRFGILPAQALAGQFVQALNQQATAAFDNGGSALTKLAQIGINFQASIIPGAGGVLSIDLKALQSAFNTDQAGTFSLLGHAARALGNLASSFAGEAGSVSTNLGTLAQQSLGLFAAGLMGTGVQGTSDLVALELLSLGNPSQSQQLAALNQYLLVSTLLG